MSFKIFKNNNISMYSMFLTILILIGATFPNRIVALIITAFATLSVTNPINLLPSFFLTSLSSDYFVAFPGMGYTRIFSALLILSFLLKNKKLVVKKEWLIEILLITVTMIITFLLSNRRDINALLGNLLNIIIFVAFINFNFKKDEILGIFKNIYISITIMLLFIFVQNLINPSYLESGRLSINESVNENRFAMMLGQMIAYNLGYQFIIKSSKTKFLNIVLIFLSLYLLLLTGSRSALIGLVLGSIVAIILMIFKDENKIKLATIFIFLSILSYFIFSIVIESNDILSYRFNLDSLLSTGGTHRIPRIIIELEHIIPDNLFFGVGLTAENETIAMAKYSSFPGSSHSIIVSMLTQMGIIGFLAHWYFILKIISKIYKNIGNYKFLIIPLILILTALFNGIGEVIYNDRLFWNAISLGGLCLSNLKGYREKNSLG